MTIRKFNTNWYFYARALRKNPVATVGVEFYEDDTAHPVLKWLGYRGWNNLQAITEVRPRCWGLGVRVRFEKGYSSKIKITAIFGPVHVEVLL